MNIKYFIKHWPFTLVMALLVFVGGVVVYQENKPYAESDSESSYSDSNEHTSAERTMIEAKLEHVDYAYETIDQVFQPFLNIHMATAATRTGATPVELTKEDYKKLENIDLVSYEITADFTFDEVEDQELIDKLNYADENFYEARQAVWSYKQAALDCLYRNSCVQTNELYPITLDYFTKAIDAVKEVKEELEGELE